MSIAVTPTHLEKAQALVDEAHAHGGLAPMDLDAFWEDDARARADPFSPDAPQVALGIGMSHECLFAELDVPEDWFRYHHDPAWLRELAKEYNDRAERIVGRRLLDEAPLPPPEDRWPTPRGLDEIFEAETVFHHESFWLMQRVSTPAELSALLDRVERRLDRLREFLLPPEWDRAKARLERRGIPSPIYRGQRGPVTFACSLFGAENLIFLLLDEPALAARFRDVILRAILERARILDIERGWTNPADARHGWGWADDNCCLLNKELYDVFAKPILQAVFDRYSPDPGDSRYQHSDSAMAQHLPTLAELGLNGCNFGPTLTVEEIRAHFPHAVIDGQIAPFTFSRNDEVNLVAEAIRDCEMAKPARGLRLGTAGSINNGSRLTGLRLVMAAIQRHGRYDSGREEKA
ncbi:MAG: uroporphyrinogen decarboxylase family protein [Kiritimatiellia bacterium]|jgi:uroporphyrinogen decarboxylase